MQRLWKQTQAFMKDEEGLGTLEMLLILAIIVVVAIAFRKWIMKWVEGLFTNANKGIDDFNSIAPQVTPAP